jgi:hypothetical protein
MKRTLWIALNLAMVIALLSTPLSSAASAPKTQAQPAPVAAQVQPPPPPGGKGAAADPMSKLDSELRDLAAKGGAEPVVVYVHAKPGTDLSKVADVTEKRAYLGDELIVAKVEPAKLAKLASSPGVVEAQAFHAIEAPIPLTPKEDVKKLTHDDIKAARAKAAELKAAGPAGVAPREIKKPAGATKSPSAPTSPSDWHGAGLIGAPEAWAKGYTGTGVNIAIIDSGVDFGHPDLEGKEAIYASGIYSGWPIALDPRSMRNYYYNGYTSWDNYSDDTDYTWYAGVYDVLHCTQGMTQSFTFHGDTFTIDPGIVAMSKSGEIRWGVHPDAQLWDLWDWIPFILVDTKAAGVYDTVIADLNFDYWFDGHDDTAVLGTSDPVLSQDLGSYIYTDTYVMTGTQYVPAGWFGTQLPPYWYGWDVASSPMTLTAGAWIYALDHNSYYQQGTVVLPATDGADGIADVSGGMVYYIADGKRPIPGMDYLYPGIPPAGNADAIPFNGQLVAFMIGSDYAGGGDHGTLCASAAAAGGQITGHYAATGEWVQYDPEDFSNWPFDNGDPNAAMGWLKGAGEGTVQGPARGAKIIALGDNYEVVNGMQGMYDSYTFLAYGVDGKPNSGDEFVQIASMSYGDGSVNNDGWDWESRLVSYYNQNYLPNTTFFISSGNGGHGFGTVNSPQGNTAVSVGASTQYGASTVFGSAITADQIKDGEVTPFSGRGPDAMGRPDPDVVATGAWGAGDAPLNLAVLYAYFVNWFVGDGNQAWYEWGGTSRAAPEAAGVGALLYDAYKQKHGSFPDFETARQILMSGANDLNHDVLMQGAGRVNADRATDVAGGLAGVYVSPSLLAAGEYKGTHYESFANVLFPGDTWTQTFTVHNSGAAAKMVTMTDEILLQTQVLTYTVVVTPYLGLEDYYPDTYYYYADYFVVADPTKAVITDTGGITHAIHGPDLAIPVPAGADLMQAQLLVPFEIHDFCYNDPDPNSICYGANQRWSLTAYDWMDRNGDGKLWEDVNGDGIVNPQRPAIDDIVDISYTGPTTRTEINRFGYSYNYANEQEVTVRLGDRTDVNNIVLGLVHRNPNNYRNMGSETAQFYQEHPLQVKVVFYKKMDATMVTETPSTLSVPAAGSATFNAVFAIPAITPPGLYDGAIVVDDGTHKSLVPTTVNVAVPSNDLLFTLGGTPKAGTPYDNGRMTGGWQWSGVYEEGDWRFYYYDANAGFDQQYLYVRNQWGQLCGNMPTFNETLVWGPNPGDQFSMKEPAKYGPYSMQFAGGTPYANTGGPIGWGAPRTWQGWTNADGTALPESRAWATLWDGLNQVQFRNVLLSGKQSCGEGFAATAGVFGVDAPKTGLTIDATAASGSFTLDAVSPVDGLVAYATGFAKEQSFRNQDVPQGKHTNAWPDDLMAGWVHTFQVTNTDGIEIQTTGPGSSDIDLYLLYDANGDGVFNPQDNRERVDYSYNSGSNESISYWGNFNNGYRVQNGTYAVVMYGYHVQPGDEFDLRMWTYGGEDLNVAGANSSNNYVLSATPGQTQNLTVNWKVPGRGVWNGWLWFAMPWEEEPVNWYQGNAIGVPVTINFGGVDLSRSTKEVDKAKVLVSHSADDSAILTYLITLVNDGTSDAWVHVADLLPDNVTYYEQYVNEGPAGYVGSYVAKWWKDNGQHGYFWPDGDYINRDTDVGPGTSGKVYIEYKVKVNHGFVGTILNKADVTLYGTQDGDIHDSMALTTKTDVLYGIFLPIVIR